MRAKWCPWLAGFLAVLAISAQGCSTDAGAPGGAAAAGKTAVNPGGGSDSTQQAGSASAQGGTASAQGGTTTVQPGGGQVGAGGTSSTGGTTSAGGTAPIGPAIGAAQFAAGDLDATSDGGT